MAILAADRESVVGERDVVAGGELQDALLQLRVGLRRGLSAAWRTASLNW